MSQLLYLNRYFPNASQMDTALPSADAGKFEASELDGGQDFYADSSFESGDLQRLENATAGQSPEDDAELLGVLNAARSQEDQDFDSPEAEAEDAVNGAFTEKGGIRYYSSKNPENGPDFDFEVALTGEAMHRVVTTEGTISVNIPKPLAGKISQRGDMLVIKVKDETIELDLRQASAIRISGDFTSQNIEDSDHKISTDEGVFISPEARDSTLEKLEGISGKIGTLTKVPQAIAAYYAIGDTLNENGVSGKVIGIAAGYNYSGYGSGYRGNLDGDYIVATAPYSVGDSNYGSDPNSQKVVDTAKQFFQKMSDALQEKDSKKQKSIWEDTVDLLEDFKAQDVDGGTANNLAHLIGNALLGEFGGKEGLLELFDTGLIPKSIASAISHSLGANVNETNDLNDVSSYQHGGPGETMTHGMMARIFDKAIHLDAAGE